MTKNLWHDIETGDNAPEKINVIVEIPKGSMNKYEYDKKHNIIKLDRVLFSPFHYPGDYGLIPQTLSEDGGSIGCTSTSYKSNISRYFDRIKTNRTTTNER